MTVSNDSTDTRSVRTLVYETLQLLLVEDDELQRQRLEPLLARANFDVCAVGSVAEARRAMEAIVFPIAIIDRKLEDGDGIELIGELRKRYSQHRVFLLLFSALDSEVERLKGLDAGADDYLSKRSSDEELMARLAGARTRVQLRSK